MHEASGFKTISKLLHPNTLDQCLCGDIVESPVSLEKMKMANGTLRGI